MSCLPLCSRVAEIADLYPLMEPILKFRVKRLIKISAIRGIVASKGPTFLRSHHSWNAHQRDWYTLDVARLFLSEILVATVCENALWTRIFRTEARRVGPTSVCCCLTLLILAALEAFPIVEVAKAGPPIVPEASGTRTWMSMLEQSVVSLLMTR
jgi:hypothetical protein